MKGTIYLNFNEELDDYNFEGIQPDVGALSYIISINLSKNISIEEIINNKEELNELIECTQTVLKSIIEMEENFLHNERDLLSILKEHQNNKINILNTAEFYQINLKTDELLEYIEKNPILTTKKIILNDFYMLGDPRLDEIKIKLKDYINNIYIRIIGNQEAINFKDYNRTVNKITEIVNHVKSLNLSPIEQIMYVYDIVRERIYKKEDDTKEGLGISRSLTSVLFGEYIVCAGYSEIFNAILIELGFNAHTYNLDNIIDNENGHTRNIVIVKDEKYKINGAYYFDTTWDSKMDENDNNYYNKYRFFAKTKEQIDFLENNMLIDRTLEKYSDNIICEFEQYINIDSNSLPYSIIKTINKMSRMFDDITLINLENSILDFNRGIENRYLKNIKYNKELVIEKLRKYIELMEAPIYAETFLKILYNVRKIEYYINPEKYPFSLNDFFETYINSDWKFENEEIKLLLTNQKRTIETAKKEMITYTKETKLYNSIQNVKLTRTLRNLYNQKTNIR